MKNLKREVYSPFIDNLWGDDAADMHLIRKFNEGIRFLCVTDIFSKCVLVISLKNITGITITNAFQKILWETKQNMGR